MNWREKTWDLEDELYTPKRKVSNRDNKNITHVIGHLYSHKMKRTIGWESLWGEYLFYLYLELDPDTVRYYEQPVEVPIVSLKKGYEVTVWSHVPDVLIFRNGLKPTLYQIKGGSENSITEKDILIDLNCVKFTESKGWLYKKIYPKELTPVIKSNLLLLHIFQRERSYYNLWEEELLLKISYFKQATVLELAQSFAAKADFRLISPLIYHLISKGVLETDITSEINLHSVVQLGSIKGLLLEFINEGADENAD
ncbi:hypothetical protein KV679_17620 [Bacillus sp. JRC01]|nr:hypothetical protein [Bacillus sp. JRC01]